MALSAPSMKGATEDRVLDLLEKAQRCTDPAMIRQHTVILVFRALAYFDERDYRQATEVAICALEQSRLVRSRLNRERIEALYQRLLGTMFRDKPALAYLGMKLRLWDHEIVVKKY